MSLVRFSSTSSRATWTSFEEVREEKFRVNAAKVEGSRDCKYLKTTVVFAVPDSPMNRQHLLMFATVWRSHVVRTVSDVGTMIEENFPSAAARKHICAGASTQPVCNIWWQRALEAHVENMAPLPRTTPSTFASRRQDSNHVELALWLASGRMIPSLMILARGLRFLSGICGRRVDRLE